jgi:hypothetical protein
MATMGLTRPMTHDFCISFKCVVFSTRTRTMLDCRRLSNLGSTLSGVFQFFSVSAFQFLPFQQEAGLEKSGSRLPQSKAAR